MRSGDDVPRTGPQPTGRGFRLSLADRILERAQDIHGGDLRAVGVYGSVAREEDGPYSDLEMMCVLETAGEDFNYEWSVGPWKAEVNFRGADVVRREAQTVEGTWALTHGAFHFMKPLYDPEGFYAEIRRLLWSVPDSAFKEAIQEMVVGEIYELMGKLRNAQNQAYHAPLPEIAVGLARRGALILGLAHKHLYSTGSRVLKDSLQLPHRPDGFDALCRLVMGGTLSDPDRVADVCETFWAGVERWAKRQSVEVYESREIPF